MPSRTFAKLEHLAWQNGVARPIRAPQTADAEALAALHVLGRFTCERCRRPLTEQNGYLCACQVHCPVCIAGVGRVGVFFYDAHCAHHVLLDRDGELFLRLDSASCGPLAEQERHGRDLLKLPAPAAPVRGHRGREYPIWSASQVMDAWGIALMPVAQRIWGHDLRELDTQQLHRILLATCLLPNMVTTAHDGQRTSKYYFCTDDAAALSRVTAWASEMRAGAERLQAMVPKRIVSE